MVDSSLIPNFSRDRTLIPGPPGHTISGPDWSLVSNRTTELYEGRMTLNPHPLGSGGVFISTATHGLGGVPTPRSLGAGAMVGTPIFLPTTMQSYSMAVEVTTAVAGGRIRLGVYEASGGTLVAEFGEVMADTTGWKIATLGAPVTVPNGMVYLVMHINNTGGMFFRFLEGGLGMFHHPTAMTTTRAYHGGRAYAALPATFPALGWLEGAPLLTIGVNL